MLNYQLRERETETDRQTDETGERQRQTDRKREGGRDRQTDEVGERQRERERERQTDRQTDLSLIHI